MRVVITGASGYLGQAIARRCAGAGVEVLGLDIRPPGRDWPQGADFALQDVTEGTLADRFAGFSADVMLHLAWVFDPTHARRLERRVDLGGTANAFAGAVAAGVKRIVYPSSTTAYGIQPGRTVPYRESDPPVPNPDYPYAYYKARVEQWLPGFRAARPEIELVVLRACIVIGPRARNIVTRIAEWPLMLRLAGYDPPMQFLAEEDAEEMLWWAMTEASPGTYNVAGDGLMLYSEICRAAGRTSLSLPASLLYPLASIGWHLRILPFPRGLLDYIRYPWVADTARLRAGTGLRPRHSTRQAFAAYVDGRSRAVASG